MSGPRRASQIAALIVVLFAALTPGSSRADPLMLSVLGAGNGPGNDPLIEANSWFLFPGQTARTMIRLSSGDFGSPASGKFAGTVKVTAQCCFDTRTEKNVTANFNVGLNATNPSAVVPAGSGTGIHVPSGVHDAACKLVNGSLECPLHSTVSQQVVLPAGGSVDFTLSVTGTAAVEPDRYALFVSAVSTAPTTDVIAKNVGPVLNVLPTPLVDDLTPPPACAPSGSTSTTATGVGSPGHVNPSPPLAVLPLQSVIGQLFFFKSLIPAVPITGLGVPIMTPGRSAGWMISVAPPTVPLQSNQTQITVINEVGWDKLVVAFDGSKCPPGQPPGGLLSVSPGGTSTVVFDLDIARTVLLKRQACANWVGALCVDANRFEDIAIVSPTNLATLFRGHRVTFDWFWSTGE